MGKEMTQAQFNVQLNRVIMNLVTAEQKRREGIKTPTDPRKYAFNKIIQMVKELDK